MNDLDLAVIGAGPAGLAAATRAAGLGLDVAVFDESTAPGGQIYRGIETVMAERRGDLSFLGGAYRAGDAIVRGFRASGAGYSPSTSVWLVQKDRRIGIVRDGKASMVRARRILIATGARERPMPIPGWTLPGVMMAGGVQALLKSPGMVPDGPVVLAGNGPLLYQLASQLIAAGAGIALVLDTGTNFRAALPRLPAAMLGGGVLLKGLGMIRSVRRAGVAIRRHAGGLRAIGGDRLEAVEFTATGRVERIEASLLCLHQGVITNTQMTQAIPLRHEWNAEQRDWRPVADRWGDTEIEGIAVAGDCAGIGGADAAFEAGNLAALAAAHALGKITAAERDRQAARHFAALRGYLRVRPFLDALYPPSPAFAVPADDVLVCRCEEVTAGGVRRAVRQGCVGPNQVKSSTRAGMGPCQGRMCALTVAEVIAAERGTDVSEIDMARIRFPIRPLTIAELGSLE